jgi:hypothetical protein
MEKLQYAPPTSRDSHGGERREGVKMERREGRVRGEGMKEEKREREKGESEKRGSEEGERERRERRGVTRGSPFHESVRTDVPMLDACVCMCAV